MVTRFTLGLWGQTKCCCRLLLLEYHFPSKPDFSSQFFLPGVPLLVTIHPLSLYLYFHAGKFTGLLGTVPFLLAGGLLT